MEVVSRGDNLTRLIGSGESPAPPAETLDRSVNLIEGAASECIFRAHTSARFVGSELSVDWTCASWGSGDSVGVTLPMFDPDRTP